MAKTMFCPPEGDWMPNPREELLRDIILNQGESYWLKGSQDGGLHFEDGDYTAQLNLWFRESWGFCVCFESDPNELPLVLTENQNAMRTVEIKQSGNIIRLPRSHFVSREAALSAVLEFCRTGKRLENAEWIEFSPEGP